MPGDFIPAGPYVPEGSATGLVADAINDGTTTVAPSQNAVFDALALKAPIASPTFTGTPTVPTATAGTNTTQVATTAFVAAAAIVPYRKPALTSTENWITFDTTSAYQYGVLLQNQLFCVPALLRAGTLIGIGQQIGTAQASNTFRFGIYSNSVDGLPDSLILDAGTIDASSAGVKKITISQTINGGIYWLACVQQGGSAGAQLLQTGGGLIIGSGFNGGNLFSTYKSFGKVGVSGALPLSLTGVTPSDTGWLPGVFLRYG